MAPSAARVAVKRGAFVFKVSSSHPKRKVMLWRNGVIGSVCLVAAAAVVRNAGAAAPSVSAWPSEQVAMPNEYFWVVVNVSDPDGDPLDIQIENAPRWLTSRTSQNGGAYDVYVYGLPTAADEGVYPGVRVLASDGQTTVATPALQISVGTPPSIEMLSTHLTARTNNYFSALAVASHSSGRPLELGIDNAPPWLTSWSFHTDTSDYLLLYGTPGIEHVGVYSNVRLTASDGVLITTRDLDLAVAVEAGNTFAFSWLAPTENEDGTPLTDLAGYRIYAWPPGATAPVSGNLALSSGTHLEISGLENGLWKLALTAYNSVGTESRLSAILPLWVAGATP